MYFAINIAFNFICDQYLEGAVSGVQKVKALIRICKHLGNFPFNFHPYPTLPLPEEERGKGQALV